MRYAGTMPVECDECAMTVTVDADTPVTNLMRLGWWSGDSSQPRDLCPLCKPGSLRARLLDALGIEVATRYRDKAILDTLKVLKAGSSPHRAWVAKYGAGYIGGTAVVIAKNEADARRLIDVHRSAQWGTDVRPVELEEVRLDAVGVMGVTTGDY